MYCFVTCLRKDGLVIPRHHIVRSEGVPGVFSLVEELDRETRRHVRVARLVALPKYVDNDHGPTGEVLPPLFDATLIYARADVWTVTGLERIGTDSVNQRACAQSWLMRPFKPAQVLEIVTDGMLGND